MTEREIRKLIENVDEGGRMACQSKEAGLQFLEESGIMELIKRSN